MLLTVNGYQCKKLFFLKQIFLRYDQSIDVSSQLARLLINQAEPIKQS
jgi:hypothetical protein